MPKQYRFYITTDCNTTYNYSLNEDDMIEFLKVEIVANNNIELIQLVKVLFTFKQFNYRDKYNTLCTMHLL